MAEHRSEELLPLYTINDRVEALAVAQQSADILKKYEMAIWDAKLKAYNDSLPGNIVGFQSTLEEYLRMHDPLIKRVLQRELTAYEKPVRDGAVLAEYVRNFKIAPYQMQIEAIMQKAEIDVQDFQRRIDDLEKTLESYTKFADLVTGGFKSLK